MLLCNQSLGDGAVLDGLLDGLASAQAQGHWQPQPASEDRRVALLPQTPPMLWDDLMHHHAYIHALWQLP